MSEDDERDAFEDIYSQLAEFRQRLEELEQLAESKVVKAPKAAPKPAERGYVKPKTVTPDTIAALREGDRDLTFVVKVEVVNPKFSWKKDERSGFGQRITVSDHTAQIVLVLWNDQCDLADNLRPNDYVTLHKVYTKRSPKGVLELQLDKQGSITPKEQVIL